jgi:magnesium-transporting ATPase (P-type)
MTSLNRSSVGSARRCRVGGERSRRYIKYDEVPFDFHRRRMSVVVHEVFKGRDLLLCKGATEEVLSDCFDVRVTATLGRKETEV